MAHLGRRLKVSASVTIFRLLPSASPPSSYHLNHYNSALFRRIPAQGYEESSIRLCQGEEFAEGDGGRGGDEAGEGRHAAEELGGGVGGAEGFHTQRAVAL